MDFVIQVQNGEPVGYPMSVENLRYIYPDIDNTLPDGMEQFVSVTAPQLGPYEVLDGGSSIGRVNGVLQDVFNVRPMTDDEKQAKIDAAMAMQHPDGWEFNYDLCGWRPVLNQPGSAPDVIG